MYIYYIYIYIYRCIYYIYIYIFEHKDSVQSIKKKMAYKRLYLSTALLFAININNHRCKIVERNKGSDMASSS